MQVKNKVAFITGGARGLGKSFAEVVLRYGGKVCIGDIRTELGRQTEAELNQRFGPKSALFVPCDVTKEDEFNGSLQRAQQYFGRLDIVVNNAGIANEDTWIEMIDINLTAVIRGCKLAIKYLSKENGGKGGLIVNVGSTAGLTGVGFEPSYAATKHGVVGYTRSIALHLQESGLYHGIRTSCLCPSFTSTDIMGDIPKIIQDFQPSKNESDNQDARLSLIKNVGIIKPSDVARAFEELLLNDDTDGAVLTVTPKGLIYRYPRTLKPKL